MWSFVELEKHANSQCGWTRACSRTSPKSEVIEDQPGGRSLATKISVLARHFYAIFVAVITASPPVSSRIPVDLEGGESGPFLQSQSQAESQQLSQAIRKQEQDTNLLPTNTTRNRFEWTPKSRQMDFRATRSVHQSFLHEQASSRLEMLRTRVSE